MARTQKSDASDRAYSTAWWLSLGLAAVLGSGVAGIAMAMLGLGVWALVAQSLLQSVFICLVMCVKVSWKPALVFEAGEARLFFGYGWKICITGILGVFYSGIPWFIIGRA